MGFLHCTSRGTKDVEDVRFCGAPLMPEYLRFIIFLFSYVMADSAVMIYFSITASTLECIKAKGTEEMWPIPSRP